MSRILLPKVWLPRGTFWSPGYTITYDGVAVDLSDVVNVAHMRITPKGEEAPAYERASPAQTSFITDGTDGALRFLWDEASTEALTDGTWVIQIWVVLSGVYRLVATGEVVVFTPEGGLLP